MSQRTRVGAARITTGILWLYFFIILQYFVVYSPYKLCCWFALLSAKRSLLFIFPLRPESLRNDKAPGVPQRFVIWYVQLVCRPLYHRKSPTVSTTGACVTLITFDSCSNFTASAYLEEKSAAIISTFTKLPYCPFLHLFSEVNCNWWYYLKPWFNNLVNPLGLLRTGCCRTEHLLCSWKSKKP